MEKPNYLQELYAAMKHSALLLCNLTEAELGRLNIQHKTVKVGKKNYQFGAYSIPKESG